MRTTSEAKGRLHASASYACEIAVPVVWQLKGPAISPSSRSPSEKNKSLACRRMSGHPSPSLGKLRSNRQRAELISAPIWDVGYCVWMNAEIAAVCEQVQGSFKLKSLVLLQSRRTILALPMLTRKNSVERGGMALQMSGCCLEFDHAKAWNNAAASANLMKAWQWLQLSCAEALVRLELMLVSTIRTVNERGARMQELIGLGMCRKDSRNNFATVAEEVAKLHGQNFKERERERSSERESKRQRVGNERERERERSGAKLTRAKDAERDSKRERERRTPKTKHKSTERQQLQQKHRTSI